MKRSRKKKVHQSPILDIEIPPELLRELFARLPVKTLLRFRCVCKHWCFLIDSPDFISMHLELFQHNRNNSRVLAHESHQVGHQEHDEYIMRDSTFTIRRTSTFRKVTQLQKTSDIGYIDNCNGLFLIYHDDIKLWNPSIRKSLMLPSCPLFALQCDVYLLGYSPLANDYKVIGLDYDNHQPDESEVSIATYSLRNHCWGSKIKRSYIPFQCVLGYDIYDNHRVFLGGASYWLGYEPGANQDTHLAWFDFDLEEYGFIELPDARKSANVIVKFIFIVGESNSIAVFSVCAKSISIWIFDRTADQPWRLWFSRDSNLGSVIDGCNLLRIFYYQENSTFFINSRGKVISYNINTHQIRHLGKSIRGAITLFPYVESLVLHKVADGVTLTSFP